MASAWKWFSDIFWSEHLWLPRGVKWTDVQNRPDKTIKYPDTDIFLYMVLLIVIILIARHVLVNYCYSALGRAIGIKDKKRRKFKNIPLLEAAYRKSPMKKDTILLAKQLDMSEREIERWWRRRMSADQPSTLSKFCEQAWKTTFNIFNLLVIWYALWDKDYFWDVEKIHEGYPHQNLTNDVWWLYTVNFANIGSTFITIFKDERQSDFAVLLFHHVISFVVYPIAFFASYYRKGAVLILLYETSSLPLKLGKTLKLAKCETAAKMLFPIFPILWFYGRMYMFPKICLNSYREILKEDSIHTCFMNRVLLFLLNVVFLINVLWSVFIIKMVYYWFFAGSLTDIRNVCSESSSSDSQLSDSCASNNQHTISLNGVSFVRRHHKREE